MVRKTARDRNVKDSAASSVVGEKDRKPFHRKLSSLIGSKRPASISEAQKVQLHKQLLKSIQEKKMRKQERDKKKKKWREKMGMQKTTKKKNKARKAKHERKIKSVKKKI